PLYLDLIGILALGASTALLLALVGNLIASWLSARSRLANFAVLRALGAAPSQIASTLTWEQCIIYSTSILLGILFGAIFSVLVVPQLIFTSVGSSGASSDLTSSQFAVAQSVPPIQIVIPPSLMIALAVLVVICVVALGMMIRVVSRPWISQTLRLNED
ncbi:MAG TPA: FtsX-like permease family protein, partial [Ktedonobacteraceae bacterium]